MRKALLASLVILVVLVSGCLGGNTTTGTTSTGSASNTVSSLQSPASQHKTPLKFLYPEERADVNMTFENMTEFFWKTYSAVPYSQHGNISVNYTDGTFRGRYEFVLTNFTSGTLYLALLVTQKDPITLNITIEGVPLELSRMDVYRWVDEDGVGIEIYAVNVSTSLSELHGVATYEFRYLENEDYLREMWKQDVLIGTDFSWWEFASRNATITVIPTFPENTVFVLSKWGIVRSGMKVVYNASLKPYEGFTLYIPDMEWKGFQWNGVNFTVYFTKNIYNEEGFDLVKREFTFAMGLYSNLTGILPVERFDAVFFPGLRRMMYKRFGRKPFGIDLGHVILVECPVDMEDSAVNYASIIFHEIAHEWAGYYAPFGYFSEPLATFMQMEAYGRWNPGGYLSWLNQNEYTALKYGDDMPFYEVVRDPMKYPRSTLTLYWKGAFMLRSLRFIVGNETFNRALHDVLEECHGSSCNYTAFIRTVENVSGEDLGWFFDEWFNSTLFPDYNITNLSLSQVGDGYNLTFTIVDASNFTMPVPVRIYLDDGSYVEGTVWVNGTATVSFELPFKPVRIVIDPDEVMANVNREFEVAGIEVDVN
ncbi:M1 family aminopeptidase [Thermococcus thioreducens]|uniref:Peptidase M1 membrane alanine aminopeptidase domain-containing protein n=2 Tax=Thermococcus thioreducens TaxID=277988 RepID=A0A1I0NZA1_9EURY|nr:M1 family aminopeptidase [Thermococcus thioreducens]SEW07265.1 hypothetical protein SAMN05216170_1392 [Thermococcus thioreducens]